MKENQLIKKIIDNCNNFPDKNYIERDTGKLWWFPESSHGF